MKFILDILLTFLFCLSLYKFGGCEVVNGKTVAYGLILWMIGFYEGSRKEKKNERV